MTTKVVHDPRECREALARTAGPVTLDLETTGLRRWDQIVSAGLLIDGVAYLLFLRSLHASIANLPVGAFRDALAPLARPDLTVVGHNLPFDLAFLRREGVPVAGEGRDTLKILRLLDQDRGAGSQGQARVDLRAPAGAEVLLNYRLKDVVRQLLRKRMPYFPGAIERVPYAEHRTYLACDLLGTRALYDHLWPRLGRVGQRYYREIVAPLIPVLLAMTEAGVAADADFIRAESDRLGQLMERLSAEHRRVARRRAGPGPRAAGPLALRDARPAGAQARPSRHAVGPVAGRRGPAPARGVQRGPAHRRLAPADPGLPQGCRPARPAPLAPEPHRSADRADSFVLRRPPGDRPALEHLPQPPAACQEA